MALHSFLRRANRRLHLLLGLNQHLAVAHGQPARLQLEQAFSRLQRRGQVPGGHGGEGEGPAGDAGHGDAALGLEGVARKERAVAAIEGVRTPSLVAKAVADRTDHHLIAGAGAQAFARSLGFAIEPDINTPIEDRPIGGLGIFLVKQFMDEVSYRREAGLNILTMVKKIQAEK